MDDMNKQAQSKVRDQHVSGYMVRLPPDHRRLLELLCKKSRRPMTVEVQIALEKVGIEEGLWPLVEDTK